MNKTSRINLAAFLWALVTVPLVLFIVSIASAYTVAVLGVEVVSVFLLVPAVGAVLSLPTYLTFGTVAFLRTLEKPSPILRHFAWNGFLAHFASLPIVALCLWIATPDDARNYSLAFAGLGAAFAPVMSVFFGWFYRHFSTSIPQTPA